MATVAAIKTDPVVPAVAVPEAKAPEAAPAVAEKAEKVEAAAKPWVVGVKYCCEHGKCTAYTLDNMGKWKVDPTKDERAIVERLLSIYGRHSAEARVLDMLYPHYFEQHLCPSYWRWMIPSSLEWSRFER